MIDRHSQHSKPGRLCLSPTQRDGLRIWRTQETQTILLLLPNTDRLKSISRAVASPKWVATAGNGYYDTRDLTQCAHLRTETAFITSCLVLVDQALSSHMIQNWSRFLQRCFCSAFVTGCNCSENTLHHSAHHRALACVTLTRFFGLANAFACLSSVGHGLSSNMSVLKSAAHYPPRACSRQRLSQ